jgi:hypothetical protein
MAHQPPVSVSNEQVSLARSAKQMAHDRRVDLETHRAAGPVLAAAQAAEDAARDQLSALVDQRREQTRHQRHWRAEHRHDVARHQELDGKLRMRQRLLSQVARWQQPAWAINTLGPLPTSRRGEAAWLAAAGPLAAYRERWQIDDDGLGPEPPPGQQHADWLAARAAINQLRQATSPVPPASQQPGPTIAARSRQPA